MAYRSPHVPYYGAPLPPPLSMPLAIPGPPPAPTPTSQTQDITCEDVTTQADGTTTKRTQKITTKTDFANGLGNAYQSGYAYIPQQPVFWTAPQGLGPAYPWGQQGYALYAPIPLESHGPSTQYFGPAPRGEPPSAVVLHHAQPVPEVQPQVNTGRVPSDATIQGTSPSAVVLPPAQPVPELQPQVNTGRLRNEVQEIFKKQCDDSVEFLVELRVQIARQADDEKLEGTWQGATVKILSRFLDVTEATQPSNTRARFAAADDVMHILEEDRNISHPIFIEDDAGKAEWARYNLRRVLEEKTQNNPNLVLSVQDSSLRHSEPSAQHHSLSEIKARLEAPSQSEFPLNMLEFVPADNTPVIPRCFRGDKWDFLRNIIELLGQIKLGEKSALVRQKLQSKDPMAWATFAECTPTAAALTAPHSDANGLDTYLTIVQGMVAIIYPDSMSPEMYESFYADPQNPPAGSSWRLIVLKAGQTVFLPAGTPHAAVRLAGSEHTLTFGGHALRPDNLPEFVRLSRTQMAHQDFINEDPLFPAVPYLAQVGMYVRSQEKAGQAGWQDQFGGHEAVEKFWREMEGFDDERFMRDKIDKFQISQTFRPGNAAKPQPGLVPSFAQKLSARKKRRGAARDRRNRSEQVRG